jgi:hypothetical protein
MQLSLASSCHPLRPLYPQLQRLRDDIAPEGTFEPRRLISFFSGIALVFAAILLLSAGSRAPSRELHADAARHHLEASGFAAAQADAIQPAATDGRAVVELHEAGSLEPAPEPIIATVDRNCAAHAREKLLVGLTNYYLQRRLRPGATSDDAAETSLLTGVLAGPGDPAASTPESSCRG